MDKKDDERMHSLHKLQLFPLSLLTLRISFKRKKEKHHLHRITVNIKLSEALVSFIMQVWVRLWSFWDDRLTLCFLALFLLEVYQSTTPVTYLSRIMAFPFTFQGSCTLWSPHACSSAHWKSPFLAGNRVFPFVSHLLSCGVLPGVISHTLNSPDFPGQQQCHS